MMLCNVANDGFPAVATIERFSCKETDCEETHYVCLDHLLGITGSLMMVFDIRTIEDLQGFKVDYEHGTKVYEPVDEPVPFVPTGKE